jgi:hypothetical protein
MAKKIYSSFNGGLSHSDREGREDSFFIGREIDTYRSPGYIMPGWSPVALSGADLVTNQIIDISDVQYTQGQTCCFAIDDGGNSGATPARIYAINTETDTVSNITYFPHDIDGEIGRGITEYECKVASASGVRLFAILDGDVAMFDHFSSWDDDWLSTVPHNAAGLSSNELHPYLKWKSYLWIGNGQYLGKLDGQTGTDGKPTWYPQKLNLGANWRITALFPTTSYIGVCATERQGLGWAPTEYKYRTRSSIFFYDGDSASYSYSLPVGDNMISSAVNNNGDILLFTKGGQLAGTLKRLTSDGTETIKFLKHEISGTETNFEPPGLGAIDIYKGRTIFGSNDNNVIFSYGKEEPWQPDALTMPYADYSVSASQIGAIKTAQEKIYFSSKKGSNYYIQKLSTGNSTNALWKGLYTDMGQKVRINYVKFYFKPLVASDSVTPTLDVDYGTSWTLTDPKGNTAISYANDGAITSKKYNVKRDCHAFRPVLDWGAGGVAFSKIVVDYTFLED